MKYLALLLLIVCMSFSIYDLSDRKDIDCTYNSTKNGLLLWNDSCTISWVNFKRVIEDSVSLYKAKAIRKVSVKNPKYNNDSIILFVKAFFNENKSYRVNKNNLGRKLLLHEQLHFDLSEVLARKIRRHYSNYISTDSSLVNTSKFINTTFNNLMVESKKLNELYDKETNHGINYKQQERWDKKVEKLLEEYNEYSNPRVVMKRKLSQ